jgi:adenylate cyclase
MSLLPRDTRLQISIAALFVLLVLPAFAAIIAFSYTANHRTLREMSQGFMDRARDEAVTSVAALLDPVVSTLRVIAAVEANQPGYFRHDSSGDVLYRALLTAAHIDAVYTSFEDGYHRVVTRIDADRRRSDPRIPGTANWHMSWIDPYDPTASAARMRHRTFYETWPVSITKYDVIWTFDIRTMPQYREAQVRRTVAVSDPQINPDTGAPVISVGYPIERDGLVVGVVSANITLGLLSAFLDAHRASPNALTVIAHKLGTVVAHPDAEKSVRQVNGRAQLATLHELADVQIGAAVAERARTGQDRFTFTAGPDGTEYVALFSPLPEGAAWQWEVLVVAPTDDFVGSLKRTNRLLISVMLGVALLECLLIYHMARWISQPIELVSQEIEEIRDLSFGEVRPAGSPIREIGQLQRATVLLHNALRSFSVFVPVDIVRGLIESGRPLAPGVEQRFMTMLFTDIENFTSISEQLTPQELSDQTSHYFGIVTSAVAGERGTIDKFIGDSVMAFWGAPQPVEDHVWRACVAAVRASRRMRKLNADWAAEGRKLMRVRIGVHCADVVVGNVGSAERLSYTVMGDGVNTASRIEGLNKEFGTSVCISDSVHAEVAGGVVARPIRRFAVRGRSAQIMVYELLGIAGSTDPELRPSERDLVLCRMTEAAMTALTADRFADAVRLYGELLEEFPDDPVGRQMRDFAAATAAKAQG